MGKLSRILLVDDDLRNIQFLYELLGTDYIIDAAQDGESALVKVAKFKPDLVLLDIMMPGIDGYEVCRQLKNSRDTQNVKIILVSGKTLKQERLKGYEAGADDFISKPFDIDELLAKIKVFARLKSMEEVNQLKMDFLNLINHETGTPLNNIIGITDILLSHYEFDPSVSESLRDIKSASSGLGDKMRNILELATLKQACLSDLVEMDIAELLEGVVEIIGHHDRQPDLLLDVEQGIRIHGDYALLLKFFKNLFENAIDISEESVRCRVMARNNIDIPGVEIIIEDSGPLRSATQLQHYFDPFYIDDLMLHSEGLNISMAICEQIAMMHQGFITIQNNQQAGAGITTWLPVEPDVAHGFCLHAY